MRIALFCLISFVLSMEALAQVAPVGRQGDAPDAVEPVVAASIHWGDFDGDGYQDALAVDPDGRLRLLRNDGGVVFVDETQESGLAVFEGIASVLVGDWDGDGDDDLVLAHAGALTLAENDRAVFQGRPALSEGQRLAALELSWIDADGDKRPDLHVTTSQRHVVLLNRPAGFIEMALDLERSGAEPFVGGRPHVDPRTEGARSIGGGPADRGPSSAGKLGGASRGDAATVATGAREVVPTQISADLVQQICAASVEDAATGGCLVASSVPTLGMLYPLSSELFIEAGSGRVGIGTTTPGFALEVAGKIVSGVGNTPTGSSAAIGGGTSNNASADHTTVAGGASNQALGQYATVGGGFSNLASSQRATIAGGLGNSASNSATVGGGQNNAANLGFATVSGGRLNEAGDHAVVGGGGNNAATGSHAVVGGGGDGADALGGNTASGSIATVAGGRRNQASDQGATVGGGEANNVTQRFGTVGGGTGNVVFAPYGTVPGGRLNTAAGADSLAAGRRAKALHDGVFVWADSTDADFSSTGADQFLVRAAGGMGVGKTPDPSFQLDVEGSIRSSDTIVSTKASGTPLQVASSDLVANLNADHLDGFDASAFSIFGTAVDEGELADEAVTDAKVAAAAAIAGTKIAPDFGSQNVETLGRVGIGVSPEFPLHVNGGGEVDLSGGGSLVIGPPASSGANTLAIDDDELQARGNILGLDVARSFSLNPAGGDVLMGNTFSTVNVPGAFSTGSFQMAAGAAPGSVLTSDALGNGAWSSVPDASWTPITSLPFTISTSGPYYLASNLTGTAGFDGIEVTVDNVLIDLNGHVLSGVAGSEDGVDAQTQNRVTVRNGFVTGWGGHGVRIADHGNVVGVVTSFNVLDGIRCLHGARISRCSSESNLNGVRISSGIIENTVVSRSAIDGFSIGSSSDEASLVRDCVSRQCVEIGFFLRGAVALNCVSELDRSGFNATSSRLAGCRAQANLLFGYFCNDDNYIKECVANAPTGSGFQVAGDRNRLDGNSVFRGTVGFGVTGVDNLLIRNSTGDVTTAYSIAPGNRDAAIISPSSGFSSSNAWANFEE